MTSFLPFIQGEKMKTKTIPQFKKAVSERTVAEVKDSLSAFLRIVEAKCQLNPHTLDPGTADSAVLLSPAVVSKMTGLSVKTLANRRSVGGGIPFQKHGSRVFYHRAEVNLYCKKRGFQNTSQYEHVAEKSKPDVSTLGEKRSTSGNSDASSNGGQS